jgi:hypothetical protein
MTSKVRYFDEYISSAIANHPEHAALILKYCGDSDSLHTEPIDVNSNEEIIKTRKYSDELMMILFESSNSDAMILRNILIEVKHPYSFFFPESEAVADPDFANAELEHIFHRLFWPELIGVDNFRLAGVPMKYCENEILIYFLHPTLEKNDGDDELRLTREETLGGELSGDECLRWINIYERYNVSPYSGEKSFIEHIKTVESLESLYYYALAHEIDEIAPPFKPLGANLTVQVWDSFGEFDADPDNLYVESVEIKPDLNNQLSWRALPLDKQLAIFDYFVSEIEEEGDLQGSNPELSSEHFLGCMALHPDTPQEILERLEALGNELVTATLARR